MATRVAIAPDLFRWAVERAGWDQETIDRRAPRLDDWLRGSQPTLHQLEAFAHATHTPLGLMFLPRPPHEEVPIPDLRTRRNERLPRPSADLLETIYLCQARQEWYRRYAGELGLLEVALVGSVSTTSDPQSLAETVRSALTYEVEDRTSSRTVDDARRALIDGIESLGILVMVSGIVGSDTHRVLDPDEFRGFALADPIAPVIFVNGADTKAAQIFTLAHELGHLLLGDSALSDASMTDASGADAELWCNTFAAELLVPAEELLRVFDGRFDPDELQRLSRVFRASTLAVLKRLHDIGLIGWEAFRPAYDGEVERVLELAAARGDDAGGNFYNTQPLRLSRRFATALISSALEGSTTYREAYRLLGTRKPATFEGLAEHLGVS